MGKNKKRNKNKRSASQRLEEIALQMQKKKAKKSHDDPPKHDDKEHDDADNKNDQDDDLLLIIGSEEVGADGGDPAEASVSISKKELQTTIDTLRKISPGLVQSSPQCRDLRKVLHAHTIKQMQKYEQKVDYRIKVTNCLHDKQWSTALQALEACRDFQHIPKQGTIQRWVRDCNVSPPTFKLKLLTAILSLKSYTDGEQQQGDVQNSSIINQHDLSQALLLSKAEAAAASSDVYATTPTTREDDGNNDLTILKPWIIPGKNEEEEENPDGDDTPFPKFTIEESQTMIIYQETASERKPPNHYDLLLHYTPKSLFHFNDSSGRMVQKHTIDFLKDDTKKSVTPFLLENVLSQQECQQLMGAATTLGYRPDHPTNLNKPTGIDSCEWLMDETTLDIILQRCKDHLPDVINTNQNNNSSFHLYSINPRWRFFRYAQNCVYRPHIDGSWPTSWVSKDESSGEYVYSTGEKPTSSDSNDDDQQQDSSTTTRSYLTFLIYLNDNFTGGQTRFYFADNNKMMAKGITPLQGSVLVFPQGNTASLIHEGSAVTKGTKYVVRSDVIYSSSPQLSPSSRSIKETKTGEAPKAEAESKTKVEVAAAAAASEADFISLQ